MNLVIDVGAVVLLHLVCLLRLIGLLILILEHVKVALVLQDLLEGVVVLAHPQNCQQIPLLRESIDVFHKTPQCGVWDAIYRVS